MLWISVALGAVQVPITSHALVAATIQTPTVTMLVITGYDPNDKTRLTEQDRDLYHKLALIRQAIDQTQQKHGNEFEIVLSLLSDIDQGLEFDLEHLCMPSGCICTSTALHFTPLD